MGCNFPTITTKTLLLRQFSDSDLLNVFKGLSDPRVTKYYGVHFHSIEETMEQMKWFRDLRKNNTGIWWAICSHDGRVFYGAIGLNSLSMIQKKAEIGFWLLYKYWGNGVMKLAIPIICEYAFSQLHLQKIEAFVENENINCKNLLKNLGFALDGTLRDCEIKYGNYISLDVYVKLSN